MLLNGQGQTQHSPRFYAVSPALSGFECGLYDIEIRVYEDNKRMSVFSTHQSQVLSRVNTTLCTRDSFFQMMKSFQR